MIVVVSIDEDILVDLGAVAIVRRHDDSRFVAGKDVVVATDCNINWALLESLLQCIFIGIVNLVEAWQGNTITSYILATLDLLDKWVIVQLLQLVVIMLQVLEGVHWSASVATEVLILVDGAVDDLLHGQWLHLTMFLLILMFHGR